MLVVCFLSECICVGSAGAAPEIAPSRSFLVMSKRLRSMAREATDARLAREREAAEAAASAGHGIADFDVHIGVTPRQKKVEGRRR